MKHDLTKGWQLEEKELLNNEKISEILALRNAKPFDVDLDSYKRFYFEGQNVDVSAINNVLKNETGNIAIYLKRNSTFLGNIIIDREDNSGVIIDAYGEGDMPLITGDDAVIDIASSNVVVKNIEITGPNAYRGIHVSPKRIGVLENILIESNFVHDINWNWTLETDSALVNPDTLNLEEVTPEYESDGVTKGRYFYRYYGGIIMQNQIGPSMFRNIWIKNNIVKNVSRTGITIYSKWVDKPGVGYGFNKWVSYDTENNYETGVGNFMGEGYYCIDNYLECPGADGITISSAKNVLVSGNTCYFANYLGRKGYWNASIWVYNVDTCLFEFNEAGYTYKRSESEDAQGFDFDNCCINTIAQYNYAHHNEGGGFLICNLSTKVTKRSSDGEPILEDGKPVEYKETGRWFNNILYKNYFYHNGNKLIPERSAFLTIARETDYVTLDSNIVVLSNDIEQQSIVHTEDESTYCYNLYFKNNIFYSEKPSKARFTIKMMKDYSFENNTYINIEPFGNHVNREIEVFDKTITFNKESTIFQRKELAKQNLEQFKSFIYKGDYKL